MKRGFSLAWHWGAHGRKSKTKNSSTTFLCRNMVMQDFLDKLKKFWYNIGKGAENMIIMAIDASTKSSGVAIFKDSEMIYHECVTASSTDLIKRIKVMAAGLHKILDKYEVEKSGLEEVRPQGGTANIQTQRALMFLQAAINFMVYDDFNKVKIEYMYPSEWRKYCKIKQGAGVKRQQQKEQDIQWVKDNYNIDVNDDVADAIGIGYGYIKQNSRDYHEHHWE